MNPCDLERVGREAGAYFTARDLMSRTFPEPRWAVPGLVAEGLNLLVGAPKLGKSWLCLGLALAVASGGRALGRIEVEQGAVLYAALEDNPRRLQSRIRLVLQGKPVPNDLHIATSLPRLPDLYGFLDGWLLAHPDARLVIVDVLRKVRPIGDGRGNAYNEDYDSLGSLKALADKHGVAVIAVHHTRKLADESDVFNEVSGSTGLTGAADAILIAKRSRNTAEAVLHITGRDVNEQEFGISWDAQRCSWNLLEEPVALALMGDTRRKILEHIRINEGDSPAQVSQALSLPSATIRQTMRRMVDDDQLGTDGEGRYFLSEPLSQVSQVSLPLSAGDSGDRSDSRLMPGGVA